MAVKTICLACHEVFTVVKSYELPIMHPIFESVILIPMATLQ